MTSQWGTDELVRLIRSTHPKGVRGGMDIDLFAGVAVHDYPRAVAWYERLFGTPATFQAHATECVWSLAEHRSVYVVQQPEHAGHAMVTVFLDDLDGFMEGAADRGIAPAKLE